MFVNYFRDDKRESPINLAAARFVLGGWLIWKTIWYDWSEFVSVPYRAAVRPGYEWAIPVGSPWLLSVEKWVLIGTLLLFVFGYRIRFTGALSVLLAFHLGTVRYTLVTSGETESIFIGTMMILFFALYAEYDRFSVDELRRTEGEPLDALADRLETSPGRLYQMPQLRFSLLVLAIIYFGSGIDKILANGGFGFASAENLARIITLYSPVVPEIESLFLNYPVLSAAAGWGTLVLETGFLLAVLGGMSITPFAFGLIGFTFTNLAVLGIFFVDALAFIAIFASFDRFLSKVALDREIDLVFDSHCRFCMRVLLPFKLLDTNGTVRFYSQYSAPRRYKGREGVDFERAMFVFHDGDAYEGYHAFRELLRQYRIFSPVVWMMWRPVIRSIGETAYRYVAKNRGRYFTCGIEDRA